MVGNGSPPGPKLSEGETRRQGQLFQATDVAHEAQNDQGRIGTSLNISGTCPFCNKYGQTLSRQLFGAKIGAERAAPTLAGVPPG